VTVSRINGAPLRVSLEDGVLTIGHEELSWEGLLDWLRPAGHSASITVTVPADCPVQLGVVSASAMVSGLARGASVKGVSSEICLDGVTGDVSANTVSGTLEARDIDGAVHFKSISGDLTVAGGTLRRMTADTVSGDIAADIRIADSADLKMTTISGKVMLRVPADSDARVRLRSTSGQVRSEFTTLRPAMSPASHSVSGSLGAGSGNVTVNSVSGPITLLRRAPSPAAPHAETEMESETR
jgi:hypothetical protein